MENENLNIFEKFQQARKKGQEEFHTSPDKVYNIISKKWLTEWESLSTQGKEFNQCVQINSDLVQQKLNTIFKYDPIHSHMWNKILLPGLLEGVDYEIIDRASWKIVSEKFNAITIERDSIVQNGVKKVNVNLVQINMIAIFPSCLSKFKGGKGGNLIKGDQFVSRTCLVSEFMELLQATLQTVNGYHFLRQNSVRLYKVKSGMTISEIENHLSEEMKDLNHYDDPMFEFKDADYLDPEKYQTIEDCDLEPDQWVMADFKESQKNWCVKNPYFPMEAKCEACYNYKVLQFPCECKKVSYCSEECKKRDENYHLPRCEKTDSDEETMNKLCRTEHSMDGKVGLKNLGNTCFMNSGIQCLSNTLAIRQFILTNLYKNDINLDNTLGTKGELVTKFSNLLRRMWFGDKQQFAPFSLKRAIGKFQPQFQGFQQHDSQELITYLLDGLHEDLNRIKSKPYVERKDYDGRPDFEVAKESWEDFKKRNDSIIVDNLYGLYKSTLRCPKCQKISITFDPYLMVNVGIPQNNNKKLQMSFIDPLVLWDCVNIEYAYDKSSDLSLGDVLSSQEVLPKIQNLQANQLIYLCTSTYQHDPTDPTEKLSSIRKKLKYKKLYIRKALQQELDVPEQEKVTIMIHESYKQYATYSWKRDITPSFNFIFDKSTCSGYDIHEFVFKLHVGVLKYFEGLEQYQQQDFEDYYQTHILDKVYHLEFKTNQTWQTECAYCDSKNCNDCPVPFKKDSLLSSFLAKDARLEMEVFIVWQRGIKDDQMIEELFNDWIKVHNKRQTEELVIETKQNNDVIPLEPQDDVTKAIQVYKPSGASESNQQKKTLGECLKFSEQPEQLDPENSWYCSECKDHVQAFKQMEIYKVPKVLIFHLKRFKNSNKFFKSKLETLIEFPIEEFDIREYVLNHHLPEEFELENAGEAQSKEPILYDLYAISNHFGGLGGGHYTAFAKNHHDQEWYNFDDSFVSQVKKEDVANTIMTSAAYCLFYSRRDQKKD